MTNFEAFESNLIFHFWFSSPVKAELMDISQKLDEKVKTGITDKDLLDIQLVADDLDLSYFYQNAYENEVLIKGKCSLGSLVW